MFGLAEALPWAWFFHRPLSSAAIVERKVTGALSAQELVACFRDEAGPY